MKLPHAFAALVPTEADDAYTPSQKVQDMIMLKTLPESSNASITTDRKSLYDLISRTAPPACGEFRTQLQAKLIKEHLQNGVQIRWVPSQVADSLTKSMDNTMLRECLKVGKYSLHDESEILKARSDSRARLQWFRNSTENMQG